MPNVNILTCHFRLGAFETELEREQWIVTQERMVITPSGQLRSFLNLPWL